MLAAAVPAQPDAAAVNVAYRMQLAPDGKLPAPSTRAAKPGTYTGFARLAALPQSGTYRVTLSGPGWIDVFQNGQALKAAAFSGATGCPGLAKSVKFDLSNAPLLIEISGGPKANIVFVITFDCKESS